MRGVGLLSDHYREELNPQMSLPARLVEVRDSSKPATITTWDKFSRPRDAKRGDCPKSSPHMQQKLGFSNGELDLERTSEGSGGAWRVLGSFMSAQTPNQTAPAAIIC